MTDKDFHLCEEGWRLFDLWSVELSEGYRRRPKMSVYDEYITHRRACPECTKPEEVSSE